jgi:hypothetical protein
MARFTGGRLCSGVRYEFDVEPAMTAVSHCTHCQKTSGSAFSIVIGVPASDVHVTKCATRRRRDRGAAIYT